jgi:hypothetical protein
MTAGSLGTDDFPLVHASADFARTAEMPPAQALQPRIVSVERLFAATWRAPTRQLHVSAQVIRSGADGEASCTGQTRREAGTQS